MTSKARTDPTIVGNYEIIRKLGKGAYGTVKLGVHIKTGEKVAIKIIKSKHIKTLKEREMVEREKKILLNLNHPHVVKLKEVIESTNKRTSYMVFEYIPGGELFRHLVSNGPMQEHEARRLFRQVLRNLRSLFCSNRLKSFFVTVGLWIGVSSRQFNYPQGYQTGEYPA
jgi:serine/threonine protein kinase